MQHSSGSTEPKEIPQWKLTPEQLAGIELQHLRTAHGWSQEELAERMKAYGYDWHQTLVGRIEQARRPLRLNEAVDLASLFGISLDVLLTRSQRETDARKLRSQIQDLERQVERARQARMQAEQNALAAEVALRSARTEEAQMSSMLSALEQALDVATQAERPN